MSTNLEQDIQLKIAINIGQKKYNLLVPNGADLPMIVNEFLKKHKLNINYQQAILDLVTRQLQNYEDQQTQLKNIQRLREQMNAKKNTTNVHKHKHNHSSPSYRKEQKSFERSSPNQMKKSIQNISQNFQKQVEKNRCLNGTHKQIKNNQSPHKKYQSIEQSQSKGCANVYQKWKIKQKTKNTPVSKSPTPVSKLPNQHVKKNRQKISHNRENLRTQNSFQISHSKNKSFSKMQSNVEPHRTPSYFYNRGILFNKEKQFNKTQKFKEIYPFTTKQQHKLFTQTDKQNLHDKLFQQSKVKNMNRIGNQFHVKTSRQASINNLGKQTKTNQQIKQKVSKKREILDKVLSQLLKQGKLKNNVEIKNVSRSPFRKTLFG